MIITINGLSGSSKGTMVKGLARHYRCEWAYSAGNFFRALAQERGKTLWAFSKIAEKDTRIDMLVDQETVRSALLCLETSRNAIFEGRLPMYHLKKAKIEADPHLVMVWRQGSFPQDL